MNCSVERKITLGLTMAPLILSATGRQMERAVWHSHRRRHPLRWRVRSMNAYRSTWLALLCLLIVFLAPPTAWAGQHVRVGIYQNSPKVAMSESGRPEGIFIDLLEAIAADEEWSLEYVPGTWVEGLDRLSAAEIDLMPDVALTQEREATYSFHRESVLSDWFQVYTPRGSGIRSVLDLNGKRVALLERSIQQEIFGKAFVGFDLNVTMVSLPDYSAAFAGVQRGNADAVIANRFYGAMHIHEYQLEDTAIIFNPTRLYYAAPKPGSTVLLDAIDKHLAHLKKDPTSLYYRSLQRWTSEEVRFKFPMWLKGAGIVAAAFLLLSIFWSVVLRRQVAVRTEELRERNEENAALYEEVRQRAEELEERVAERTTELAVALEHAESADRLKSAFLATMSHELRTPLNSIIGFTGIILQGLAGPLNPEQSKQLEMVRGSARHLLALINDVLDISKIEAGQMEVTCESFDLRASIEKAAASVKLLAEKKGLVLRVELAPEIGVWASDQRRVEQILINLLNNAIKFTEYGQITLTAGITRDSLCISIADTGIGIKPEDLQKLFQPFRQIDTGMTRNYDGTGLGLAICRRLAELLGGEINAESEWGKGSTFTVLLYAKDGVTP